MKTKSEKLLPKITSGSIHVQYVSCGKPNCKCAGGELHGPYYYYFTRINGKLKKRYIKHKEVEQAVRVCLEQRNLRKLQREHSHRSWEQLRLIRKELRDFHEQFNI